MRFNSIINFDVDATLTCLNLLEIAMESNVIESAKIDSWTVDEEIYETFFNMLYMDCDIEEQSYDEENLINSDIIKTAEITEFNQLLEELSKYNKEKAKKYNDEAHKQEYYGDGSEVTLENAENGYAHKITRLVYEECYEDERDALEDFLTFRSWFKISNKNIKNELEKYIKKESELLCLIH